MKDVYLMDNRNKIIEIQDISGKNKEFDLPYYIFRRLEENNFQRTISPMKIGFKITNKCLFQCNYCFTQKNTKNMSLDIIRKSIEELNQKPYEVYLTGGEPLLHPNIFEIIQLFYNWDILLKIHTTGITTKENIEYLKKNINKIELIQISIDSISKFEKIRKSNIKNPLEKIKEFVEGIGSKEKIIVNTVISNYNYTELKEIIKFCKEIGIKKFRMSPIFSANRSLYKLDNELIDIFYEAVKYCDENNIELIDTPFSHPWSLRLTENIESNRLFCPAYKTEIEIDAKGNIYPCPFLHDEFHKLGNLYERNINDIWLDGPKLLLENSCWTKNIECLSCKNYLKCGGGCYANAYITNKDYDVRCIVHDKNK